MSEIVTVGLDLAKNVFQAHGADASGRGVLRKKLRRDQVLAFFGQLPPCVVAMEACGGAHFWGREIGRMGHEVRVIPPAYVKPFVKRQKNDAADAEAICEAATLEQVEFLNGQRHELAAVDRGYRGHDEDKTRVLISGSRRGLTPKLIADLRHRSAIEAEIGHMKTDGRLSRCPLKGTIGDALFAVLCACGHNIRKILAHLRSLLAWIIATLWAAQKPGNSQQQAATLG